MDGGKSRRQDNNHRRTQNKKPPRGFRKPSVASWEMEFCKVVGAMEWDVFLQKKKDIHLHPRALEWNDIAGEEAFNNAKRRFWSQKCKFSCDVPLPDPDVYINDIDWDSKIDIDRDLDCSISVVSETEEDDEGLEIFGYPLMPESYQAIVPTGWGDECDNFDTPVLTFSARFGDLLGAD